MRMEGDVTWYRGARKELMLQYLRQERVENQPGVGMAREREGQTETRRNKEKEKTGTVRA